MFNAYTEFEGQDGQEVKYQFGNPKAKIIKDKSKLKIKKTQVQKVAEPGRQGNTF